MAAEPATAAASASSGDAAAAEAAAPAPAAAEGKPPTVILMVGMAGAGKTMLMQRLNAELRMRGKAPYVINLDPAVATLPYAPNVDIRDTVNYKEVMKQYELGPNGAIVTSLNLFATRFDQVIRLVEGKRGVADYVLVDTPGQIEVFTWSASGSIITDLLAGGFPTVLVFTVDTPRCKAPATFMSNMLYACRYVQFAIAGS